MITLRRSLAACAVRLVLTLLPLAVVLLFGSGCAEKASLPKDANLETFVSVYARCVFIDRAYSREPELLSQEISEVKFPANWSQLVDSLLAAHGGDPGFWYEAYSEIVKRSRR